FPNFLGKGFCRCLPGGLVLPDPSSLVEVRVGYRQQPCTLVASFSPIPTTGTQSNPSFLLTRHPTTRQVWYMFDEPADSSPLHCLVRNLTFAVPVAAPSPRTLPWGLRDLPHSTATARSGLPQAAPDSHGSEPDRTEQRLLRFVLVRILEARVVVLRPNGHNF